MSFFSSSIALTRYHTDLEINEGFRDKALELIQQNSFQEPLSQASELSFGWVSPLNPFGDEIEYQDIVFDNYLHLAMRVDTKRVSAALVKKHRLLAEEKAKIEKNLKFLSKSLKEEIKDRVMLDLLTRTLASPQVTELVWDIDTGNILFLSIQDKARGIMETLFEKTFGKKLSPVLPITLAKNIEKEGSYPISVDEMTQGAWV